MPRNLVADETKMKPEFAGQVNWSRNNSIIKFFLAQDVERRAVLQFLDRAFTPHSLHALALARTEWSTASFGTQNGERWWARVPYDSTVLSRVKLSEWPNMCDTFDWRFVVVLSSGESPLTCALVRAWAIQSFNFKPMPCFGSRYTLVGSIESVWHFNACRSYSFWSTVKIHLVHTLKYL